VLIVLKSGSLNLLETLEPARACNGIALLFFSHMDDVSFLFFVAVLDWTQTRHALEFI
jgi:hypothetical protein